MGKDPSCRTRVQRSLEGTQCVVVRCARCVRVAPVALVRWPAVVRVGLGRAVAQQDLRRVRAYREASEFVVVGCV
eukprot:CAMPEP_0119541576 /NCGR_PEP_ID=MMETSP1344-20130328/53044_1 /TAXON_ID=236787 /ORGANISM="Florenciella parvula, Strain CCMP2471" /LENGTH=74 /DNA_ID=CAMNT_0007585583 /DNA_START=43 /DNA_END=263 /DNA_ORIENTATION=-